MDVSREDLTTTLAELEASVQRPEFGLFGPESLSWRIDRESVLFLGGGRAALLQLAHPFVAHAVDQHSATRSDPLGRFQRTFDNVYKMVFGDLKHALGAARRVHAIHCTITGPIDEDVGCFARGSRYSANDRDGLMWVHATLIDSALLVYETVLGPLSARQREAYYEETKRFALLFGLTEGVVPKNHAAFREYMSDMLASPSITVGRPARELSGFLLRSPSRVAKAPFAWLGLMTAGLLPTRQRKEFGLPWGRTRQRTFDASLAAIRRGYPLLPEKVRFVPAYTHALGRLSGRSGPDFVAEFLEGSAKRLAVFSGLSPQRARGAERS